MNNWNYYNKIIQNLLYTIHILMTTIIGNTDYV